MKIWQSNINELDFKSSMIIYYDDPAWIRILEKLTSIVLNDYKSKAILGSEITTDWFYEEVQNLTLFSEKNRWNIFNSDKISINVFNKISKEVAALKSNQDTILWFWLPLTSKKKMDLPALIIDKLNYWEVQTCVKWLMNTWGLNFDLLDSHWPWDQELTLSQHLQLLEMYSLDQLDNAQLMQYFQQASFEQDKFRLLSLLERKDWKKFWNELNNFADTESLRLVQFLKNYVFKMAKFKENSNYVARSAFDKKILASAQKWNYREILKLLKTFSDWEILAKAGENLQYKIAEEIIGSKRQ